MKHASSNRAFAPGRPRRPACARLALAILLLAPVGALATGQTTLQVSVDVNGGAPDQDSYTPAFSGDGRFVAFLSDASDLVPGDTNGVRDAFVHDLQSGTTERVSVDSSGVQGSGDCWGVPALSWDGRFVVFWSEADDLVAGDTNLVEDVFVRDRLLGTTVRVSVGSGGVQGNGHSVEPTISANGRLVGFVSWSDNLVPGDTNSLRDVFVHDLQTAVTTRVSVDSSGAQSTSTSAWPGFFAPALSADGRCVAFLTKAEDLLGPGGDTNQDFDVFVHDRVTGTTERVSVRSDGAEATGDGGFYKLVALSGDGRFATWCSRSSDLVVGDTNGRGDVFVHDRTTHETRRISMGINGAQANGHSTRSTISADGRHVVFTSEASNLVAGHPAGTSSVYLHDRLLGQTEQVSLTAAGAMISDWSRQQAISGDGRHAAFLSYEALAGPSTNGLLNVFVRDRQAGPASSFCLANANSTGAVALLSATGSASAAAADLQLLAAQVPNQFGLFFHGDAMTWIPFGNGFLCAAGSIVRGQVVQAAGQSASYVYDGSDSAHDLSVFVGTTRYFQFWYRDPAGGGASINTSSALSVSVAP